MSGRLGDHMVMTPADMARAEDNNLKALFAPPQCKPGTNKYACFAFQVILSGGMEDGAPEVPRPVREYDIVPYRPRNPPLENHHGIMDAWAKVNVTGYVERAPDSTTIALSKANHDATKATFRDWLRENYGSPVGVRVDWTSMGPREIFGLFEDMFDSASVPQNARDEYYSSVTNYFYSLGS
jgi:hypothetical protein